MDEKSQPSSTAPVFMIINPGSMRIAPPRLFPIALLTFTTVSGCGTLPGGPTTMSSRTFNVTGFSLPVAMVFSESPTAAQVAGISRSADAARGFVMRSVMQAVFDVLEQQGRAAGLPDFMITSILNQLTVNINYTPLDCKRVEVSPAGPNVNTMMMVPTCVIFSDTVTALCNDMNMCISRWRWSHDARTYSSRIQNNLRNSLDLKHHYGELVERHVAESGEQSGSSLGI
ncbi:hypothetical protein KIN20_019263 [Parelaphostrongylus tenuis]|uniref:Uncharacterized protein n=1 Tax=Parelaphostrongylus tenuis TaxID=148309 RepID=A0AAD5QS88_PARTN|nr:hypothetical protein KIN20_019263 [Parelaphostrongylus tenuis]